MSLKAWAGSPPMEARSQATIQAGAVGIDGRGDRYGQQGGIGCIDGSRVGRAGGGDFGRHDGGKAGHEIDGHVIGRVVQIHVRHIGSQDGECAGFTAGKGDIGGKGEGGVASVINGSRMVAAVAANQGEPVSGGIDGLAEGDRDGAVEGNIRRTVSRDSTGHCGGQVRWRRVARIRCADNKIGAVIIGIRAPLDKRNAAVVLLKTEVGAPSKQLAVGP